MFLEKKLVYVEFFTTFDKPCQAANAPSLQDVFFFRFYCSDLDGEGVYFK